MTCYAAVSPNVLVVGRFAVPAAVVAHRKPRRLLEEDGEVALVHVAALRGDLADGEVAFLQQRPHALQLRPQDDVADGGIEVLAEALLDVPARAA